MLKMSHFFKIILSHTHQHKLELPVKFVSKYGEELSNVMYIDVPSGAVWRVRLLKRNGRAWLDEGWAGFVRFYSIALGHFLMFNYEGNSRLQAIIFDMTASEIEYRAPGRILSASEQPKSSKRVHKSKKRKCEFIRGIIGHDGAHAYLLRRKIVMALQSKRAEERPRVEVVKCEHICKPKRTELCFVQSEKKTTRQVGRPPTKSNAGRPSTAVLDESKKHIIGYPSFELTMTQGYVTRPPFLPSDFVRKHIRGSSRGIQLQCSGRSWPLWMITYKKNNRCKFSAGWCAFVRENHLRVGDVCIFELIRLSCFTFNVIMCRC